MLILPILLFVAGALHRASLPVRCSGAPGSILDLSTKVATLAGMDPVPEHWQGISAKMGLDATRPVVYDAHVFTRVRIRGQDEVDLDALARAPTAASLDGLLAE